MKDLIKKWWFWLIILIFIIIFIPFNFANNKGVGSAGISLEEFEKIEIGMTMTQVAEIINSENREDVRQKQISRIADENGLSAISKYEYMGEKRGYAIITYEFNVWSSGLKVVSKEKFDLK